MQSNFLNNQFEEIPMQIEDENIDAPPVGLYNPESNQLVPLKFADVNAEIHDNFAKVTINHYYENLYSKAIDTEFIFPKTKKAIFDSLKACLDNGETITAEILSSEEGNKKFNEAKQKGDLAVLADIDKNKPDLVKTRIGNLAAGQKVKVTFTYVTQLDIAMDKCYQFKFANVFIPRYSSKKDSQSYLENPHNYEILPKIKFISEADIGALNEQFAKISIQNIDENIYINQINQVNNLVKFEDFLLNKYNDFVQFGGADGMLYPWAMRVSLNTSFKFSNLKYTNSINNNNPNNNNNSSNSSNLFDLKINAENTKAIFETNLINFYYPNKDIQISFEDPENFKTPSLILNEHPVHRNEFAFYFKFNPKFLSEPKANAVPMATETFNDAAEGCNFLFVIDRSGSMAGSRMETAKNSLVYFLKSLPEGSKFNIVSFGSNFNLMYDDFKKATDNSVKETLKKVEGFKADMGGTELLQPFQKVFADWKKNLQKFKKDEKIRIFVLTDGSIDNPDNFLSIMKKEHKFFSTTNIDLRVYSLGVGSGCSEYLIKGIAENGQGKSELALNNQDVVEKVIYLLDNSIKPNLKNFKIYFENNQNLNDSLLANADAGGELNAVYKTFNETIEFFSRIEIANSDMKNLDDIKLIVSYTDVDNSEEKFVMPLAFNLIKDDDTLFKIWVNQKADKYFAKLSSDGNSYDQQNRLQLNKQKEELIELSIKYQCLNRLTSLFMVLKEKNVSEEELKIKKYISLANSDISQLDAYSQGNVLKTLNAMPQFNNFHAFHNNTNCAMPMSANLCMPQMSPFASISSTSNSYGTTKKCRAAPQMAFKSNAMMRDRSRSKSRDRDMDMGLKSYSKAETKKSGGFFSKAANAVKGLFGSAKAKKSAEKIPPLAIFKQAQEKNFIQKESERCSDLRESAKVSMEIDSFVNNQDSLQAECEEEDFEDFASPTAVQEKADYSKPLPAHIQPANAVSDAANVKLIEQEILKSQNFNGSWDYNGKLWSLFGNSNCWSDLLNAFANKFAAELAEKNKKDVELIAFTVYVLNYIRSKILEKKTLNQLKLIIAKAEKYVNGQTKIDSIYGDDIKIVYGL